MTICEPSDQDQDADEVIEKPDIEPNVLPDIYDNDQAESRYY